MLLDLLEEDLESGSQDEALLGLLESLSLLLQEGVAIVLVDVVALYQNLFENPHGRVFVAGRELFERWDAFGGGQLAAA